VTGSVGSATPEAVAALAYLNMGLPLPWTPSARFQVPYASLLSPPAAAVVRATTWTPSPGQSTGLPQGMPFKINPVDGRLIASTDYSFLGDSSLILVGVPAIPPEGVASLFYANGCIPLSWTLSAKFTVSYVSLVNPPSVNVVRATVY
jgi:hypothetical protein